ncbi:MAG: DUF362 domain-containing protein [Chloroflexota bacterium]|jgi:uncharacterized protein (DUF362 family)
MSNFPGKGKVAVIKTAPDSILEDIEALLRLGGIESSLPKSASISLKIKLSGNTWYPTASTTPWQLEGVIHALQKAGYRDISRTYNLFDAINPNLAEINNKHKRITDKYQIPCIDLCDKKQEFIQVQPRANPFLILDEIYPDGVFIPKILAGKNLIHLPTVKQDALTTIDGAMKNAIGGLLRHKSPSIHRAIHEVLVDLLLIQQEIHPGVFTVMDGTLIRDVRDSHAFRWRERNILLASADQVAVDAVSARLQGFDPLSIPFIRLAHELDLGVGDPRQIDVTGSDINQDGYWNFNQDTTLASTGKSQGSPQVFTNYWQLDFLDPARSNVSKLYHNFVWQPFIGRKHAEQALRSRWGQLFLSYGDGSIALPGIEKKTVARAGVTLGLVAGVIGLIAFLHNLRKKK